MSETPKAGDRVRYRAGRGYGEGRVANVADRLVTISTSKGKLVNRLISQVEVLPLGDAAASQS